MRALSFTMLLCAACTSGGGSGQTVDAAPDSAPVPVTTLADCPAVVDATIMDSPTMFIPKVTTVPKHAIVKFVITAEHFVLPNTLPGVMTDDMLRVSRGETKCFRFDVPGSYGFLCGVHGFTGTVAVQ